jgi:hypothetical protein
MKRLKFRNERVGFVFTVAIGMAFSLLFDVLPFGVAMGLFGVIVLARVFADRRAKASQKDRLTKRQRCSGTSLLTANLDE